MKRLLLLLALVTGCKTWDVRAFDVPLNQEQRHLAAAAELSSEEKVGVLVVLAVAVGVGVAIALAD